MPNCQHKSGKHEYQRYIWDTIQSGLSNIVTRRKETYHIIQCQCYCQFGSTDHLRDPPHEKSTQCRYVVCCSVSRWWWRLKALLVLAHCSLSWWVETWRTWPASSHSLVSLQQWQWWRRGHQRLRTIDNNCGAVSQLLTIVGCCWLWKTFSVCILWWIKPPFSPQPSPPLRPKCSISFCTIWLWRWSPKKC